jgi:GDP-L-fucose synthase
LPALMRRFHEAKERGDAQVVVWGSGTPRREFLHVDDLADALVFLMKNYDGEDIVNVGWGKDVTIRELAELIRSTIGFDGSVEFDCTKPDGTPRKLLDTRRLQEIGWSPRIGLEDGLSSTYEWFLGHRSELRV